MLFLIILLTFVLVVDCLALIFLVLIQLPKKEAGAGLAFGGSATDALFGAGSGTVLTKITKYAAGTFFVLALLLSVMQSKYHHGAGSEFEKNLLNPTAAPIAPAASTAPSSTAPASKQASQFSTSNLNIPAIGAPEATNLPVPRASTSAPSAGTNTVAPK